MNIINIFSFYSPIIILSGIYIYSIFSMQALNGFIYLFWLFFVTMIRIGTLYVFGETPISVLSNTPENICNSGNIIPYANVSFSSYIFLFSFFYITMPMFISNNINYLIILFFIIYFILDILVKLTNSCFSSKNSFSFLVGDIIGGGGLGAAISALMYSSSLQKYLFINSAGSNKEVCSMPSKQSFKCSVYKNGELVTSSNV